MKTEQMLCQRKVQSAFGQRNVLGEMVDLLMPHIIEVFWDAEQRVPLNPLNA